MRATVIESVYAMVYKYYRMCLICVICQWQRDSQSVIKSISTVSSCTIRDFVHFSCHFDHKINESDELTID